MTIRKLLMPTLILTAALMATVASAAQSVEPIWLSPRNFGWKILRYYDLTYPELGVWTNISIGAGSRFFLPIVTMDSRKTLWILHGGTNSNYGCNVWNYDPQTDLYRWVAGPGNSTIYPRNPGELRVPSPDNHPGVVLVTPGSIDHNDNIWFMTSGFSNMGELWMFNTTSFYFTRMKGNTSVDGNTAGVLGTIGQPGDDVSPGGIQSGCLVVDSQNNLWQIAGTTHLWWHNQIWHFNTTSYQWTFFGGQTYQGSTLYGYSGEFANHDIDDDDRIWLFGGQNQMWLNIYEYNDVWSYDTRTLQWGLEYGSNASFSDILVSKIGAVAKSNDFDADNHPASATYPSFVDRKDGTLMLVDTQNAANAIWLFHKTLKQWKLIYNPTNASPNGNFSHYRTPGSVMPTNLFQPGSSNGLNTQGDVFIYGGGSGYGNFLYNAIWLIPQDQCSNSTSNNCSSNARCIELDVGYSCECNDGFAGNGFTCEVLVTPVSPNSPSSPPSSPSTPLSSPSTNEPIQSPSDEPVASPSSTTPLSSSQPSSTPHHKPQVSNGMPVKSSLFTTLSFVVFVLSTANILW